MIRRLALCVALLLCMVSPLLIAQRVSVSGTIAYRERIALPPAATVEVTLEDVSRADAPADVIARLTLQAAGQVPIPFDLPYDPSRIDDGHRYAVRARILDGQQLLFATTETTLVVTQGHGSRVSLMLRLAPGANPAPPAPAAQSAPSPKVPLVELPPVVELRNLPATFTGTLPCADCSGIRYELTLAPDDVFFLRTTYVGRPAAAEQDDLGSWVLSSDRRVVILKGARPAPEYFAIRDNFTLRKLDMDGRDITSKQPHDLRRSATAAPLDVKATIRGTYHGVGEAGRFTECTTGETWPVAQEGASRDLDNAARLNASKPGVSTFATIDARLASRSATDRSVAETTVVAERVVGTSTTEVCTTRFAAAPLENTSWVLTHLGTTAITPAPGQRNQPNLTFRAEPPTFSGSGGCNRVAGQYDRRGDALTLSGAGTLMACVGGNDTEAAFATALRTTRAYRILGRTLELYGDRRQLLATFEAK